MSTAPTRSQGHRHTPSADSAKFESQIHGRGGEFLSAETVGVHDDLDYSQYPANSWARFRENIREPAAEMLGTMILTLVGTAANCQAVLGSNTGVASSAKGDWLSLSFGWACSVSLGAWIASSVSGGHVNPVITLSMAIFRPNTMPWRKVPGYVIGQLVGAWLGAIVAFSNYFHAIDIVEGQKGKRTLSTAGLFGTFALDYMPSANCFFDEFIGTFILLLVVFAVTDGRRKNPLSAGLVPLVVFIAILGIAVAFGMQTGFAINPARDLGPRVMTAMVGYGREVFNFRRQYWLWAPILGSTFGGLTAAFLYDALICVDPDSIFNTPDEASRRHAARQKNASRPSGSNLDAA